MHAVDELNLVNAILHTQIINMPMDYTAPRLEMAERVALPNLSSVYAIARLKQPRVQSVTLVKGMPSTKPKRMCNVASQADLPQQRR
jgi:hypothetical protein